MPTHPFCITDMLTNRQTIEQFSVKLVLGHHAKRSNRITRRNDVSHVQTSGAGTGGSNSDGDDEEEEEEEEGGDAGVDEGDASDQSLM